MMYFTVQFMRLKLFLKWHAIEKPMWFILLSYNINAIYLKPLTTNTARFEHRKDRSRSTSLLTYLIISCILTASSSDLVLLPKDESSLQLLHLLCYRQSRSMLCLWFSKFKFAGQPMRNSFKISSKEVPRNYRFSPEVSVFKSRFQNGKFFKRQTLQWEEFLSLFMCLIVVFNPRVFISTNFIKVLVNPECFASLGSRLPRVRRATHARFPPTSHEYVRMGICHVFPVKRANIRL